MESNPKCFPRPALQNISKVRVLSVGHVLQTVLCMNLGASFVEAAVHTVVREVLDTSQSRDSLPHYMIVDLPSGYQELHVGRPSSSASSE